MILKKYDGKCVRIITAAGEAFEGTVSFLSRDYVLHEYGRSREALLLVPILFYKDEIADIISLEAEQNGRTECQSQRSSAGFHQYRHEG